MNSIRLSCASLLATLSGVSAHAIEIQLGDMIPRAPGVSFLQYTYGDLERHDQYKNGNRVSRAPHIQAQLSQLRYVRYTEVADMPVVLALQQPWGSIHATGITGGKLDTSGSADTILLAGIWPYSNKETNTHVVVAAYYSPPTGTYNNRQSLSLGENRHKAALQLGYQTRLFEKLDWMIAMDGTRYGANDEFGTTNAKLTQQQLYSVQTGFNYLFNNVSAIGLSLFHTYGGETAVNGVGRKDPTRTNRYLFSGTYRLPEYKSALNINFGRDLNTLNGTLETKRLSVRLTKSF